MSDRFNPVGLFSIERRKKLPSELPGDDADPEETTLFADTVFDLSTPGRTGMGVALIVVSEPLRRLVSTGRS